MGESLHIAKQIANALESAHESGIVHRDLKPANIKIRPDGSVKVLDFGLAEANDASEDNPDSPTLTMTSPGTIMGTPGYMPPEQIRGEAVDKRADIWAFGVVLYEMVSGRRPFEGRTSSDMMAAVIEEDPVFDGTLRQGFAVQLEQSPFLSLISDDRIQRTLSMMTRPADTRLTPDIGREICERTGSAAVLDGSIASLGNQYVLGLRAKACGSGAVLDEEQVQAARKEDVLNALTEIASKFRTRVGESLSTIEKHNTPLAEATTQSLEALKAYSQGLKVLASSGDDAASPFFKRATEIDPQFAMAQARLGLSYMTVGESALAAEHLTTARQLRNRANDAERFFIDAMYDPQATGNLEKAQQTCQEWAQNYPREKRRPRVPLRDDLCDSWQIPASPRRGQESCRHRS